MKLSKQLAVPGLLWIALALAGCGPSPQQMTSTAQAAGIMTLTAAPTLTPAPSLTPTASPTPTATVTFTPTSTETPTVTPTPTPDRVVPGNYYLNGCGHRDMPKGGTLEICVTQVNVDNDHHLFVYVTWALSYIPNNTIVTKRSDEGNRNVYLTDEHGKRYDHIAGLAAAYADVNMGIGGGLLGIFDFGPAAVGAFTFTYHDEDNGILVGGFTLSPGNVSTVGIVTYENFLLDQYPLLLVYRKEIWDLVEADDGSSKLVNKNMPACTLQAQTTHAPAGTFKSQVPVGEITYDIYGYFDETAKFFVREYIYVSGLPSLDAKTKPFFYVSIPAETSDTCILEVSSVLSGLAPHKP